MMTNTRPLHLTYIWLDAEYNLRQKVRIIDNHSKRSHKPLNGEHLLPENYPIWNFDGSSTGQATRENSEILLVPARVYISPFENDKLFILCECCSPDMQPHPSNHRPDAKNIFNKPLLSETETMESVFAPLYGIEQEFFFLDPNENNLPVEFTSAKSQGKYYCAVDSPLNHIMEQIINNCLKMGIKTVGFNTEVAPGQAEVQLLSTGLEACDDLIMLRYIIIIIAKNNGYNVSFHPKPLEGDWNGSGAHVNYSTRFMRNEISNYTTSLSSYEHIMYAIGQFEQNHQKHIAVYGKDNDKRLTGEHETSDINTFSYGIADRGASIRIPRQTHDNKCGYIEDRRPSSNFNPYLVLPLIFETSVTGIDVTTTQK